jgi:hypothetical protein
MDIRAIGPLITLTSALVFLLYVSGLWGLVASMFFKSTQDEISKPLPIENELPHGRTIRIFNFLRLIGCLSLLSLSVMLCFRDSSSELSPGNLFRTDTKYTHWIDLAQCAVFVRFHIHCWTITHATIQLYTCILSSLILSHRWTTASSCQLNAILSSEFVVYFYRDVVPLGMFTRAPTDAKEGAPLWAMIGILAFTTIFIPLFIPSRYIPNDPSVCSSSIFFQV